MNPASAPQQAKIVNIETQKRLLGCLVSTIKKVCDYLKFPPKILVLHSFMTVLGNKLGVHEDVLPESEHLHFRPF